MIGGLLVSTLLTLFVIPLFYLFPDDLRLYLRRLATTAFRRKAGSAQAVR
ncbi:MAG: hypothetical protein O3B73_03050 [bacterium]|nr:hypothetical protein [bacterium]